MVLVILSKEYYNASIYLDYKNIDKFIDRHKSDKKNSYLLWSLVVLQIFLKKIIFN